MIDRTENHFQRYIDHNHCIIRILCEQLAKYNYFDKNKANE